LAGVEGCMKYRFIVFDAILERGFALQSLWLNLWFGWLQMESEFPEMLPIRESLIKYVFEPAAAQVSNLSCSRKEWSD
jgi:hypothetical protein